MIEMQNILNKKLEEASIGLSEWHRLDIKYSLKNNDYVVLFCDEDREINEAGMVYLDTFLNRIGGDRLIILTDNQFVIDNIKKYSDNLAGIEIISKEQSDCFISLYSLFHFDHRFRLVSLDKPFCRKAKRVIGVKGTTVEQLVAIGIFGIIPFKSLKEKDNI